MQAPCQIIFHKIYCISFTCNEDEISIERPDSESGEDCAKTTWPDNVVATRPKDPLFTVSSWKHVVIADFARCTIWFLVYLTKILPGENVNISK